MKTEEFITDEELKDKDDSIYCRVCGKFMKNITPSHLVMHNMTMELYKKRYPNVPLVCKNNIEKSARGNTLKYKNLQIKDSIIEKIQKSPVLEPSESQNSETIDFAGKIKNLKISNVSDSYPGTSKSKILILMYLQEIFGDNKVFNNYYVEKMIVDQYLDYRIITDISIPSFKIDIEFINAFWHNQDIRRPKYLRDEVLKRDGWTIIDINIMNPTPEDVKLSIEPILEKIQSGK